MLKYYAQPHIVFWVHGHIRIMAGASLSASQMNRYIVVVVGGRLARIKVVVVER